ncbi:MAG TPA: TIGR00266 family protein [Candidatus Methanofastidiosa archaeon]|nr:TIGR00266 family protein [Candidatus Methanofastidiosa archaeon]HPR41253.1 TIGR00266 family protein [Candidatus Methanofastidiosa archaeon]
MPTGIDYEYEIFKSPAYTLLKVGLKDGQEIKAEAGALVSMTPNLNIETKMQGGMFNALKRSALGGESFFQNIFKADGQGEITLAPGYPGDVERLELNNETWFLQGGAFLASNVNIDLDTKFQGLKGFVSREGLFFLKAEGVGDIFISAFGALYEYDLDGELIVDTGHLVGFQGGIQYEVKKIGGLKSTFLSGEGLVLKLRGRGKVFMQTRNPTAFASWLTPMLPFKK